jgi:hypothetical protein
MKAEITKYNRLAKEVKPPGTGKHADLMNVIGRFWRAKESELPQFATVLRAVLTHSPNSVPPERVFSILNDTFGDDQESAYADYIELSLQLQYNARGRNAAAQA